MATSRPPAANSNRAYRRVVVKVGTNLLTGGTGRLDTRVMSRLVTQMARLYDEGRELLLVSSGAVAAGRQAIGLDRERAPSDAESRTARWEVPYRQALAAMGQGRLMHLYQQLFARRGIPVGQALVTHRDIADRLGYLNIRNTLLTLLSFRAVPVLNENDVVAVEELEGEVIGDNDTLSGLVSNMVDADLLVMLGDVEGLYTADPGVDPEARLIPRVERADVVAADTRTRGNGIGRGGMAAKLKAADLATASGCTVVIAGGRVRNVLPRIMAGEAVGTWFPPAASRPESRQRWILSAASARSALEVDTGAVRALRQQNRSLLPAGVRTVQGSFQRGEVVLILGPQGDRVAAGIANYNAADVRRIIGMRSDSIGATLGYQYGAEVVHRNNMVVLQ